jgi:FkbM family methyltransferase
MIFEVGGMPITLIDTDDRQVIHMVAGRGYEKESLSMWASIVKAHRVALDIGAYTGLYSIIAAKFGAQAVAMEPMPVNRWRMNCNFAANKVAVLMLPVAASDEDGVAKLCYNPRVPLTTGASLEPGVPEHTEFIMVDKITVDALALTNVAAIKIDVERHEPCVLRGARNTIERDRPSILIETLDAAMRMAVLNVLPSYEEVAILDGRNTLYLPK